VYNDGMTTLKQAMSRLTAPHGKHSPAKMQEAEDTILSKCSKSEISAMSHVPPHCLEEALLRAARAQLAFGHK
jgi:hypothetical protein